MKKILIIAFLLLFQIGFSQKEKTGKIIIYKSNISTDKIVQSTTDSEIKMLNNKPHIVELYDYKTYGIVESDKNGIFKIPGNFSEIKKIVVDQQNNNLNKTFYESDIEWKSDTLILKISDERFSRAIDSVRSPKFYQRFKIEKAEYDFLNKKRQILIGKGIEHSEKYLDELDSLSKKYNFNVKYLNDMTGLLSEHRIIYRYNKKMLELMGVENWR